MKTLYHCSFELSYHFVFATKYRRKVLTGEMLTSLEQIVRNLCERWGCNLAELNGEPDHVHLLLELNPRIAPSVAANNLKTVSSRLLRKEFGAQLAAAYRGNVLWSRSYFVATCGGAPLEAIKRYIQKQNRPI